ncbi:hypothetical protein BaRGS_00038809, partial [Batillaria attramentaria]
MFSSVAIASSKRTAPYKNRKKDDGNSGILGTISSAETVASTESDYKNSSETAAVLKGFDGTQAVTHYVSSVNRSEPFNDKEKNVINLGAKVSQISPYASSSVVTEVGDVSCANDDTSSITEDTNSSDENIVLAENLFSRADTVPAAESDLDTVDVDNGGSVLASPMGEVSKSSNNNAEPKNLSEDDANLSPPPPVSTSNTDSQSCLQTTEVVANESRIKSCATQTSGGQEPASLPPIFSTEWQVTKEFSDAGGTLQKPGSDVILCIPRDAVKRKCTVHEAICGDIEKIRKTLKLPADEYVVSPAAEFSADNRFLKSVRIKLPHCLPPDPDLSLVQVYCAARRPDGSLLVTRLRLDPSLHINMSRDNENVTAVARPPPVMNLIAKGSAKKAPRQRYIAKVNAFLWDERLELQDIREAYGMCSDDFTPLTSLTLLEELEDTRLIARLQVLGEEREDWQHMKGENDRPALPVVQVCEITSLLSCDAEGCPKRHSTRPRPVCWILDSKPGFPVDLASWHCNVEMCHIRAERNPSWEDGNNFERITRLPVEVKYADGRGTENSDRVSHDRRARRTKDETYKKSGERVYRGRDSFNRFSDSVGSDTSLHSSSDDATPKKKKRPLKEPLSDK